MPDAQKLPVSYEDVGLDLGVSHLATMSNGEVIDHPRYYRKAEKQLARRQQSLARKKRGSHRREKAKRLVNRYQVIVFEDLQTTNITKAPKPKPDEDGKYLPNGASAKAGLNKSILDAGWGMFVAMTSYKAALLQGSNMI